MIAWYLRSFHLLIVTVICVGPHAYAGENISQKQKRSLISAGVTDKPPVIDGKLDDPIWKSSANAMFAVSPKMKSATVSISYSAENLYLAIKMQEDAMATAVSEADQRDGKVWADESVEVFLAPRDRSGEYYQLVVNRSNVQFDAKCKHGHGDTSWDAEWKSQVHETEEGWQVELEIPFSALSDSAPTERSVWGFNVCRNRVQPSEHGTAQWAEHEGSHSYSWSPLVTGQSYHQPYNFGMLRFGGQDTIVRVEQLGDLFPGSQQSLLKVVGDREVHVALSAGKRYGLESHINTTVSKTRSLRLPYTQRVDDEVVSVVVYEAERGTIFYASGFIELDKPGEIATFADSLRNASQNQDIVNQVNSEIAGLESSRLPYDERLALADQIKEKFSVQVHEQISSAFMANGPKQNGRPVYGIAIASSMTHVFPQSTERFKGDYVSHLKLSGARNEMEAGQVVIYSPNRDLANVEFQASELTSDKGDVISNSSIWVAPVGFVKTEPQTTYQVSHTGWYPDPILQYLKRFKIQRGDIQPVWYSVRIPNDTPAGIYTGTLKISSVSAPPAAVEISVEVWDFTLPTNASLPTAIDLALDYLYSHRVPSSEELEKLQITYDQFLANHRTNPSNIYIEPGIKGEVPDFETLKRWKELGFTMFNIRSVGNNRDMTDDWTTFRPEKEEQLWKDIEGALQAAEQLDMLDHVYVYGWDEWKSDKFPGLNNTVQKIKDRYPQVKLFTTARDNSYGNALPGIDWYCPEIYDYNFDRARNAREKGKKIWWYTCLATKKPYPTHFIEYPLTDTRMILGFMSYSYQADGYLYWGMSRNNNNRKILVGGPYTSWDPRSIGDYHGDGHLIYPGFDGPITSLRMENWLDGLEDYEYLVMAKDHINALRSSGKEKLADSLEKRFAKYDHPENNKLIKSLTEYTDDPQAIENARRDIAEIILAK